MHITHNNLKCFVSGSIQLSAAGPKAPNTKILGYSALLAMLQGSCGPLQTLRQEIGSQTREQLILLFYAFATKSSRSFSDGAFTTILRCPPSFHSKNANSLRSSTSTNASICWQALRAAVATHSAILQSCSLRSILTTKIILQSSSSSSKSSQPQALGNSKANASSLLPTCPSTSSTLPAQNPISINSVLRL